MAKRNTTPTLPALAACPFCSSGSPGAEDLVEIGEHKGAGMFSVRCGSCGAEGPSASDAGLAAARWNTPAQRTPANPLVDPMSTRGTLENVAALQTWLDWHPLCTEAGHPGEDEAGAIGFADTIVRGMVRDAVKFEAKRSGA